MHLFLILSLLNIVYYNATQASKPVQITISPKASQASSPAFFPTRPARSPKHSVGALQRRKQLPPLPVKPNSLGSPPVSMSRVLCSPPAPASMTILSFMQSLNAPAPAGAASNAKIKQEALKKEEDEKAQAADAADEAKILHERIDAWATHFMIDWKLHLQNNKKQEIQKVQAEGQFEDEHIRQALRNKINAQFKSSLEYRFKNQISVATLSQVIARYTLAPASYHGSINDISPMHALNECIDSLSIHAEKENLKNDDETCCECCRIFCGLLCAVYQAKD